MTYYTMKSVQWKRRWAIYPRWAKLWRNSQVSIYQNFKSLYLFSPTSDFIQVHIPDGNFTQESESDIHFALSLFLAKLERFKISPNVKLTKFSQLSIYQPRKSLSKTFRKHPVGQPFLSKITLRL